MSENAFKNRINPAVVERLAGELRTVWPDFDGGAFIAQAIHGLDALELKARIDHVARAARRFLPDAYPRALGIVVDSLGPPLEREEGFGDSVFFYWIHAHFVQVFGVDHPGLSLEAMVEITQRSTAEFAVRPYLLQHPEQTLTFLRAHLGHANPHVRRWISEGTRPRLPWGERLHPFVKDPSATLELLRALRRDSSAYVRTSVANHLNDIAKDHPGLAVAEVVAWLDEDFEHAEWIARKALRHLVKQGHPGALEALGYDPEPKVELRGLTLDRDELRVGEALTFAFELEARADQNLMIDFAIDFRLARGKTGRKVFKLTTRQLDQGQSTRLEKKHPFRPITTRRYYPGRHSLTILVNGREMGTKAFELVD